MPSLPRVVAAELSKQLIAVQLAGKDTTTAISPRQPCTSEAPGDASRGAIVVSFGDDGGGSVSVPGKIPWRCSFLMRLAWLVLVSTIATAQPNVPTYRLTIYDFTVQSPEIDRQLGATVADLLRISLSRNAELRVVERQEMSKVFKDRDLAGRATSIFDDRSAVELGKVLEANYVVLGTMTLVRGTILLSTRLVHVPTTALHGGTRAQLGHAASAQELGSTVDSIADELIERMLPSSTSGTLTVTVTPAGSRVRILNQPVDGPAPLTVALPIGTNIVVVQPPDEHYEEAIRAVEVRPNSNTELTIVLSRRKGVLRIRQTVGDAVAYIDGALASAAPRGADIQVEAGRHDVTLLAMDGSALHQTIEVRPGVTTFVPSIDAEHAAANGKRHLVRRVATGVHPKWTAAATSGVFIVAEEGGLLAYDSADLVVRWRFSRYDIIDRPIPVGRRLFVPVRYVEASQSSLEHYAKLIEIDASTGAIIGESDRIQSRTTYGWARHDTAVFTFNGPKIYAVAGAKEGLVELTRRIPRQMRDAADWNTARIFGSLVVALATDRISVHCFNIGDTSEYAVHKFDSAIEEFEVAEDNLIVARSGEYVECRRIWDASSRWQHRLGFAVRALVSDGAFLYAFDGNDQVSKIAIFQGASLKSLSSGRQDGARTMFHVMPDTSQIVLVEDGHRVALHELQFETSVWSYHEQSRIRDLHTIDDRIYTVTESGQISLLAPARRTSLLGIVLASNSEAGVVSALRGSRLTATDQLIAVHRIKHTDSPSLEFDRITTARIKFGSAEEERMITLAGAHEIAGSAMPGDLLVPAGALSVTTGVSGTHVWIDNRYAGSADRALIGVEVGRRSILLIHTAKMSKSLAVEVNELKTSAIEVPLRDFAEANTTVTSTPSGAKVFIDGNFAGLTPHKVIARHGNQIARLIVHRNGYRDSGEQLLIGERQQVSYNLKYGQTVGGVFVVAGTRQRAIAGWADNTISVAGVKGAPLYVGRDNTALEVLLQHSWRRVTGYMQATLPFGGGAGCGGCDTGGSLGVIGGRLLIMQARRAGQIHVGMGLAAETRTVDSWATAQTRDLNAKYFERLKHPIANVLVNNDIRSYRLVDVQYRPKPLLIIRVAVGQVLGATLRGVGLEESPGDRLTKTDRKYELAASGGHTYEGTLYITPTSLWARHDVKSWSPMALLIRYRQTVIDYGLARERGSTVSIGIGFMLASHGW